MTKIDSNNEALESIRQDIDRIDSDIQRLLNERATCAQKVADVKLREFNEKGGESPLFYRPEREAQVLRAVKERNTGPLDSDEVAHIFREIMSACLALEQPIKVAYLGPSGTFTQAAAIKQFGHAALTVSQPTINAVFSEVERKQCHYGIVPVENSTEGMVAHTLDNFLDSPLKICGEVALPVELHLLVQEGVKPEDVQQICAHQQALAQSRSWLEQNYPDVEVVAVKSNGEAAAIAAKDTKIAAVAGEIAKDHYQLHSLAKNIQDYANNTTRFLVISQNMVPASGKDKTSVVVSTKDVPGALYRLLSPLQREGISLTRIESRPSRTENWAYVFFMEFEGHYEDDAVKRVLESLTEESFFVKVLGSYPIAVI